MPASRFPLARVQRWMQAVIEHPGTTAAAVAAPPIRRLLGGAEVGDLLLPSATLDPVERVGIYHGMYLLRMRDALRTDYAGVAAWLGEEAFESAVRDYVRRHPSTSYTLNRLGDRFPRFLAGWRGSPRPAFLADLARLELLATEAFDAAETPGLAPEAFAAVAESEWPRVRLAPIASLRLAAFSWPVGDFLDALREGRKPRPPRPRDRGYAVFRRDWRVRRLELAPPALALLTKLVAGVPFGRAVAGAVRRDPAVRRHLFGWMRVWSRARLFAAIEPADAGLPRRPRHRG